MQPTHSPLVKPEELKGFKFTVATKVKKNKTWIRIQPRVLKINVLRFPSGSKLSPIAAFQDPY